MYRHPAHVQARRRSFRLQVHVQPSSAPARGSPPSRHPRPPMRRTASPTTCSSWRASRPGSSSGNGEAWVPLAPVVPWHRPTATWWMARSWGEPLQKRTRRMRSPWQMRSRLTGGWTSGRRSCPRRRTTIRESQEIKVKVQRSLKEAEAQSFELYHPQVDQAIRKKEELHKALREQREPTPEEASARRRHKELVTEEMLDNEMAILAPLHATIR